MWFERDGPSVDEEWRDAVPGDMEEDVRSFQRNTTHSSLRNKVGIQPICSSQEIIILVMCCLILTMHYLGIYRPKIHCLCLEPCSIVCETIT